MLCCRCIQNATAQLCPLESRQRQDPARAEPLLGNEPLPSGESIQHAEAAARQLPGFWRQYSWCFVRAIVLRMREPLAVFTDYAVFALTGAPSSFNDGLALCEQAF